MEKTSKPIPWPFIIFLTIVPTFLFIANLVIYESVSMIFSISEPSQLLLLGSVLGFLSASFIASTLLGMRYYNFLTRKYYLISAVWMGFFTYLFFASVVYGILVLFIGPYRNLVGEILIFGALLVGVYGVFHARKINIVKINVSLQNLPEKWRGRKAVWMSDLHLGQLHGSGFARKIVRKINTIPHDIVFIGGDLYDGTGAPDVVELVEPLKELTAQFGTHFITGNHEEFGHVEKFLDAIRGARIGTIIDQMIEIDGLQIVGVDYRNASNKERFENILKSLKIQSDKPSILLKHEPKDLEIGEQAGISLQISGHTHKAQLWPLVYMADWVYKGFAYGLKNHGKMQVYTSSGVGTWGPPLRVGTNSEIVLITFI